MDLSALIFVALAVAWAVYLIPKALRHHDDDARSRSVDRFSHTMRVLARREPVGRRSARLVVTPGRPASTVGPAVVGALNDALAPVEATAAIPHPSPSPAPSQKSARPAAPAPTRAASRREAAARAARRRLRVVTVILVALLAVVAVCAFGVIGWTWVAAPVVVLAAWLVACRLMVKKERAVRRPARLPVDATDTSATRAAAPAVTDGPVTDEIPAVVDAPVGQDARADQTTSAPDTVPHRVDPNSWDPVPVTLPTYVTKPTAARRTVRTIDLDDTGVWTSGRTDADSQIAREADQAQREDKAAKASRKDGDDHRAVGS